MQLDLFFNEDAQSTVEQLDLCDCPIYFGTSGKRRQDLNSTSDFLSSVPTIMLFMKTSYKNINL